MNDSKTGVRSDELLECNNVTTKLPQYFDDAEMWFHQVEAVFRLSRITSETSKFLHVMASLPPAILIEFQEWFTESSNTPYSDLRRAMIKLRQVPISTHFDRLFNTTQLGDRRPTEHLRILRRHYQQLGMQSPNDHILRHVFLKSLPVDIQKHLTGRDSNSLDDLAKLADDLTKGTSQYTVNAADDPTTQIAQLTTEINLLKQRLNRANSTNTDSFTTCYYHRTFGSAARKCQPPCDYNSSGKAKGSE